MRTEAPQSVKSFRTHYMQVKQSLCGHAQLNLTSQRLEELPSTQISAIFGISPLSYMLL